MNPTQSGPTQSGSIEGGLYTVYNERGETDYSFTKQSVRNSKADHAAFCLWRAAQELRRA